MRKTNRKKIAGWILAGSAALLLIRHSLRRFPRGDLGFTLGMTAEQAEANAQNHGLVKMLIPSPPNPPQDDKLSYRVPQSGSIRFIGVHFSDKRADSISIIYGEGLKPSFKDVLHELRWKFGWESDADDEGSNQAAYWSDRRTLIQLQGRAFSWTRELSVKYMDLSNGSSYTFAVIGG